MDRKVCVACNQSLKISEFALKVTGRREARCKSCRARYQHDHYVRNRQIYIARSAARRKRVREERLQWLVRFLESRPCADCGETDPLTLEFDHLGNKEFSVGQLFSDTSWDRLQREIAKCDVVCANCHHRREAERAQTVRFRLTRMPRQRRFFFNQSG